MDKEPEETKLCRCGKSTATIRMPLLADKEEAARMSYWSCDECFARTWAGEN